MQTSDAPISNSSASNEPAPSALSKAKWLAIVLGVIVALAITGLLTLSSSRELAIESQPAGASVFINGRLAGKTPVRVSGLPSGAYSLRIEKESFIPVSKQVAVGTGATTVNEILQPRGMGALRVSVDPIGAEVLLDGELIGHTPLEENNIPTGSHELLIRKTNFKAYSTRIAIDAGEIKEYKDFALEDLVQTMLQNAIDQDKQRVAHYMDMGRYLFTNNKLKDSADFYVRGLEVAGETLVIAKEATPQERLLEQQLRERDRERIHDELRKIMAHPGRNVAEKDMRKFIDRIRSQIDAGVATGNPRDWNWIYEQARNLIEERKYDKAEQLYIRHIDAAKGMDTVAQAHINLISLRIHYMQNIPQALLACKDFAESPYSNNPALARQAANAIYGQAAVFKGKDKTDLLKQAESLLRRALGAAGNNNEMSALCKFELANVLCLQENFEAAVPLYRDSVVETHEPSTKELRSQRQVDALRKLKRNDEAREILKLLTKSPRSEIAAKAQSDLRELEAAPQ